MLKFCRECECVMPGAAAFCPRCGVPWRQPFDHSIAEAADLLQPPIECAACRKHLAVWRFYCSRCGAGTEPVGWSPATKCGTA